jgi:hypothetical protein
MIKDINITILARGDHHERFDVFAFPYYSSRNALVLERLWLFDIL